MSNSHARVVPGPGGPGAAAVLGRQPVDRGPGLPVGGAGFGVRRGPGRGGEGDRPQLAGRRADRPAGRRAAAAYYFLLRGSGESTPEPLPTVTAPTDTPTLPTEIPTPSIPTPTLTVPSEVPSPEVSVSTLQLMPAVDVADGHAVRLVQGAAGTETDYGDPLEAALQWQEQGAQWIHLVDLDAAFGRGSNRDLLAHVGGGWMSTSRCPAGSATTSRWRPRWPPAVGA